MLILRILSWNSAPQPPLFLPLSCSTYLIKHLTHWKFQSIAVEPEILWKRWFAWAFCCCFFSCYAIFTWIWTYKTHDLTEYQLTIGSFLPATTFMWSDWQIPEWPQLFQQFLFPSVPFLVDFKCAIIFRSFHFDFLCASANYYIPFVFEFSLRQSFDPSWKLQSCALLWFQ